jgi:ATP-dependent DNA helicase PIF1
MSSRARPQATSRRSAGPSPTAPASALRAVPVALTIVAEDDEQENIDRNGRARSASSSRRGGGSGRGGRGRGRNGGGFGQEPARDDPYDPNFALTLRAPTVTARLNFCDALSETAMRKMGQIARRHGREARARQRAMHRRWVQLVQHCGPVAARRVFLDELAEAEDREREDDDALDHSGDVLRAKRGGILSIVYGSRREHRIPASSGGGGGPGAPSMSTRARGEPSRRGGGEPEAAAATAEDQPQSQGAEPTDPSMVPLLLQRRRWGGWFPHAVNVARCPPRGRRFSVQDEALARLSEEQRQAVFVLEAGVSCFVTGPGGTGKTELIRVVKEAAERAGMRVRLTASTGIAARNIGGTTLHRFVGMGLMDRLDPERAGTVIRNARPGDPRAQRWAETDLLIVDEISMLSMRFLKQVDAVARAARERTGSGDDRLPFGGVQLLFLGDFAQLVMQEGDGASSEAEALAAMPFMDPDWKMMVPLTVELRTIFRQKAPGFRNLLNRLRLGRLDHDDLMTLNAVSVQHGAQQAKNPASHDRYHETEEVAGPDLCAFRAEAKRINESHVSRLRQDAASVTYAPRGAAEAIEAAAAATSAEGVELCVGTRVLLTKNVDPERGLVNGSLGKVVGFVAAQDAPDRQRVVEDMVRLRRPAIHRTALDAFPQLPMVEWEPSGGGGAGGGSAAVPEGGSFTSFGALHSAPLVTVVWPIVWLPEGASDTVAGTVAVAAGPEGRTPSEAKESRRDGNNEGISMAVVYMPLLCAWAMTVHRAQGMTLSAATVHASSMKTPALLYTAISRLRSMDGLRLRGKVEPHNAVAYPQVVRYYTVLAKLVDDAATTEQDSDDEDDDAAAASVAGSVAESILTQGSAVPVPPSGAGVDPSGSNIGAPASPPPLAVLPSYVLADVLRD